MELKALSTTYVRRNLMDTFLAAGAARTERSKLALTAEGLPSLVARLQEMRVHEAKVARMCDAYAEPGSELGFPEFCALFLGAMAEKFPSLCEPSHLKARWKKVGLAEKLLAATSSKLHSKADEPPVGSSPAGCVAEDF